MNTIRKSQPDIWVLWSHAVGDNAQCMTLAEALDRPSVIKRLDWQVANTAEDRAAVRRLLEESGEGRRRRDALGLRAPWPALVICCGRRSSRIAFWIKRQSGGRTKVVSIGRAHRPVSAYDLLIASPQFLMPERANVVHLRLPISRQRYDVADVRTAHSNLVPVPKPWFTILLGGSVRQFAGTEKALRDAALRAQMAADRHGGSVVICTSRRTPEPVVAAVECVLNQPYVHRWSVAANDNPYETLLSQSACLFVTGDSASMIADGCASGAPTYIIEFPERADLRRRWRRELFGSIRRMSGSLRGQGLSRAGSWLDGAQDWLHARNVLRYPRDLRRVHASAYEIGLARPAACFDPAALPPRGIANDDLDGISGFREAAARCRALYDRSCRRAAE
jgi:hypothetical protein